MVPVPELKPELVAVKTVFAKLSAAPRETKFVVPGVTIR